MSKSTMSTPFELGTVKNYLVGLQSRITGALTALDGTPFLTDAWQKDPGEKLQGNGITQILEGGPIFERAGCGFSHVTGPQLPPSATQHRPELAGSAFEAMGVSLVFHPRNPYVPTVHMNVRMIAAKPEGRAPVAWFGGGMDLTPYYGFDEDAVHFHQSCKDALAPFGEALHPRFKTWCDDYFCNKHRREQRGVGGIFFDDFSELGMDQSFAMLQSVGDSLLTAYMAVMSSSIWSGTVAPILVCSPVAVPSRSCCPCRPKCVGRISAKTRRDRQRNACSATFWCPRTGFESAFCHANRPGQC
jgi:coproporphyrinogen III oxidase